MKRTKHIDGLSLVIPVYNNAKTLKKQLQTCIALLDQCKVDYEVIISEDRSTDTTRKVLKEFSQKKNVHIFYQKNNLGIAKNIFFLYKKASKSSIVLYSIDGGWNPEDIIKLHEKKQATAAGIVVGKRDITKYPLTRKIVSYFYNSLPILLFGVHTYDSGSIKIFDRALFNAQKLKPTSISFEAEMLIKAAQKGYTIQTVPVQFSRPKALDKSSVNMILVLQTFRDMLRLRLKGHV